MYDMTTIDQKSTEIMWRNINMAISVKKTSSVMLDVQHVLNPVDKMGETNRDNDSYSADVIPAIGDIHFSQNSPWGRPKHFRYYRDSIA